MELRIFCHSNLRAVELKFREFIEILNMLDEMLLGEQNYLVMNEIKGFAYLFDRAWNLTNFSANITRLQY